MVVLRFFRGWLPIGDGADRGGSGDTGWFADASEGMNNIKKNFLAGVAFVEHLIILNGWTLIIFDQWRMKQ